ncbi:hypothetical protein ELE36_02675 [Pseudolysobacter antarcticus]|uniref:CSLREA domain-containing protein n=1 Tax=Pseudolysobacter antarcticus TaxID=2511995 RepID=A0A411HFT6_9GAMM|nr:choice-of-anchor Q domain-containing protein [Pseudolysobacter antarcticus]QBB69366.1 hypothetical protein ELE36_02675 [Pseudolysobacter antarcticus]
MSLLSSRFRLPKPSIIFLPLLVLLLTSAGHAATITVGGACTLVDAINAAETDIAVGNCAAGAGNDDIVLTTDVVLSLASGTTGFEPTGLPPITTLITIHGNGHTISRAATAANFMLITVSSSGVLALDTVTLSGGSGTNTGAIENAGNLTLHNTTIANNHGQNCGGIINENILNVTGSLFVGNSSSGNAGAIFNYSGTAMLTNTTISGNSSAFGGGLNNSASFSTKPAAIATLDHCTVSGNTATFSGQNFLNQNDAQLTLKATLINGADNCQGNAPTIDGGLNFGSDGSCTGTAPLTGFDAALRNNGGPSMTHALLPGSSAIDIGAACGLTDQRGLLRDAHCDSGAFEYLDKIFGNGFEAP